MTTPATIATRPARLNTRFDKGAIVSFLHEVQACREDRGQGDIEVEVVVHSGKKAPVRFGGWVRGMLDKDREGIVAVLQDGEVKGCLSDYPTLTLNNLLRYQWQLHQCEDFPAKLKVFHRDRIAIYSVRDVLYEGEKLVMHCRAAPRGVVPSDFAHTDALCHIDRTHLLLPAPCLRWSLRHPFSEVLTVRLPEEKSLSREEAFALPGSASVAPDYGHPLFILTGAWEGLSAGAIVVAPDSPPPEDVCRRLTPETLAKVLPDSPERFQPATVTLVLGGGRQSVLAIGRSTEPVSGGGHPVVLRLHDIPPETAEVDAFLLQLWAATPEEFIARWSAVIPVWLKNDQIGAGIDNAVYRLRVALNTCDWQGRFCREALLKLMALHRAGCAEVCRSDEYLWNLSAIACDPDVKAYFASKDGVS